MVRKVAAIACLTALTYPVLGPAHGHAQESAIPASTFALTNARIVVAPGNVIETGTVVISDGRIAAVGSGVMAPAGAIELDLSGQTVYPGMIDVAASVGLPIAAGPGRGRGGGGGGGRGGAAATSNEAPPEVRPFRLASDDFAATDAQLDGLRQAGITALGLAFRGGIFPGQVAAVGTGTGASQVLRTPVAMQVAFNRNSGGYPGTLMGALAYIEQSWEDTKYDMRVQEAFSRDPTSAPRPQFDRDHAALIPAVTGQMPVWFEAQRQRDFTRVSDLAARIGVTDYVILGGQEGYLATELLGRLGVPVIVSLDYPDPDQVTGRAFDYHIEPVSGDDAVDEEADSAVARALRGNAATLTAAGVTIALSSRGGDVDEFRTMVAGAVEAGLSHDDALRAVTVTPATLLGLDGVLGTIEQGKLANLVVTDGDLFDEEATVLHVFVEGRRYDYSGGTP